MGNIYQVAFSIGGTCWFARSYVLSYLILGAVNSGYPLNLVLELRTTPSENTKNGWVFICIPKQSLHVRAYWYGSIGVSGTGVGNIPACWCPGSRRWVGDTASFAAPTATPPAPQISWKRNVARCQGYTVVTSVFSWKQRNGPLSIFTQQGNSAIETYSEIWWLSMRRVCAVEHVLRYPGRCWLKYLRWRDCNP